MEFIDSHIKKLRKKISAAAGHVDLIHSVYGVGYKFEYPPEHPVSSPPDPFMKQSLS